MAAELGIATAWIFTAFSAGLLVSAFLGPTAGRLIDVHGGRRVLPVSNLVFAAGLALIGVLVRACFPSLPHGSSSASA